MIAANNTWESLFTQQWQSDVSSAPDKLQAWLKGGGSLTSKLTDICHAQFNVELLHQTLCFATPEAAEALNINEGEALLHREVLLRDGEKALVFACSLLPERALTGSYEELRQLDERPLGHWIFAEPALQRAQMLFAELAADDPLFVRAGSAVGSNSTIWGRASYFSGAAAPLLVSEFFLSDELV